VKFLMLVLIINVQTGIYEHQIPLIMPSEQVCEQAQSSILGKYDNERYRYVAMCVQTE
jgi:hypothetical protein